MNPYEVVMSPVMSEKGLIDIEIGKYAFYVHPHANRSQIRDAIEVVFNVDVVKINLLNQRGKVKTMGRHSGRSPKRKKAIVTLKPGQRIQELDGLA